MLAVSVAALAPLAAQGPNAIVIEPDSPLWELSGRTAMAERGGRRCLAINGGGAGVRDLVFQDGTIAFDAWTSGARGFFGVEFRADAANGEYVYLRPHKSGLPDAIQYTPVLNTGLNWQLYTGDGFTGRIDIPRDTWLPVRIEVRGTTAQLFVGDATRPVLIMPDLKSGVGKGSVGLAVLLGETCFSNVRIEPAASAPVVRNTLPMPPGILTTWELSPSLDAQTQDIDRLPDLTTLSWQRVEAEHPGLVPINRYRPSPHPRVSFQSDFSTRMAPQPGAQTVYARTTLTADRAGVRKLQLGYSDEVTVFLNGTPLFRGRSAQSFRDPGFLGNMDVENDAVYLPLRAGANDLVLAVTELGGGWGFIARLDANTISTP